MSAHHCSFCGKADADVLVLIAAPREVFICDECVGLCVEIVDEYRLRKAAEKAVAVALAAHAAVQPTKSASLWARLFRPTKPASAAAA